ncbi:MAG TPA: glutaminyl-peptide cyclotransferase [Pyrinomonadaceae bacterium]|nr:glutaminyl-peptide cyclotransferase [Pyrinomonadaceae bacterium]
MNKPTNTGNTNKTNSNVTATNQPVPVDGYEIVKTYKHDEKAFTQGLVFVNGFFYESDGEYGESNLRKVEVETGKVLQKQDVAEEYFAEGMTILNDKIYQITWQEKTAFQYDMNFKLIKEFRYQGEGWGLTNDGTNLIMSDGTHVIRFINPETFETVRTIVVKDEKGSPIYKLNELEYIKGEIWANIWHSESINKPNHIARINPADGKLLGWVDLQGISPEDVARDSENTLNGIAYDAAGDRIFVTGKQWKKLFEIKLKPKQ